MAECRTRLIPRAMVARSPRLIVWKDFAIAAWLLVGVVICALPPRMRWAVSALVAHAAIRSARARSARLRMCRIGGLSDAASRKCLHALYTGRLAAHIDVVRGLLFGPDLEVRYSGLDKLDTALAKGAGVILWVTDFVGAANVVKVGLDRHGYKVKHLSRPEHGFSQSRFGVAVLNPLRIRFEARYVEERVVFDRNHPAPAMMHLAKHLRANGIVSIGASNHEGRTLVQARFFQGLVQLAAGAVKLSLITGAPLIPIHAVASATEPGVFDLIFDDPLSASDGGADRASITDITLLYIDRLEYHVALRPEIWVGWRRKDQLIDIRDEARGPQ